MHEPAIGSRQMHMQRTSPGGIERSKIAEGLRELEGPERKRLARDRDVAARRCGDEHEHAGIGTAFMKLAGRMEIPRPVPEHCGGARAIADRVPKTVELVGDFLIRSEVSEQADVVAITNEGQDR